MGFPPHPQLPVTLAGLESVNGASVRCSRTSPPVPCSNLGSNCRMRLAFSHTEREIVHDRMHTAFEGAYAALSHWEVSCIRGFATPSRSRSPRLADFPHVFRPHPHDLGMPSSRSARYIYRVFRAPSGRCDLPTETETETHALRDAGRDCRHNHLHAVVTCQRGW